MYVFFTHKNPQELQSFNKKNIQNSSTVDIPGLNLIQNFIDPNEETKLISQISN